MMKEDEQDEQVLESEMGGGHTQIALKESLTSRIPGGTRSTNRNHPPVPRQPSIGLGGFLSRGPWPAHEHRLTQGRFPDTPKALGVQS